MALGSKKRDYKTEDRGTRARLAMHFKLMNEYMADGLSRKNASRRAFKDVIEMQISNKTGKPRS